MEKSLKFLLSSVVIALTVTSNHTIHSMEDFSNPDNDVQRPYRVSSGSDITETHGTNFSKKMAVFRNFGFHSKKKTQTNSMKVNTQKELTHSVTEESQQEKSEYEEIRENPFEKCSPEITFMILELAAIGNYLSDGNTGSLMLVCRDWRRIMRQKKMKQSIESAKHEYIYQRFLKGVLIYRPDEKSDVGKIELLIRDLANPLEGTFDLSKCRDERLGDVGQYLSISTGYRKEQNPANKRKLEIWLVPRFLAEKELQGTANYFKEIFPVKWKNKAPVGIIWTWGGDQWMGLGCSDYLTNQSMDDLSNNNLHALRRVSRGNLLGPSHNVFDFRFALGLQRKFHIRFV